MEQFKEILAKVNVGSFPVNTSAPKKQTAGAPQPAREVSDAEWAEYNEKLKKTGYAPLPNCPRCGGAGFYHLILSDGKVDYSKVYPCKSSGCVVEKRKEYEQGGEFRKRYGITKTDQTFTNFKQIMGTGEAYQAFYALAMGEGKIKPFLLCYGGTGNGKTHLCHALVMAMVSRGLYPKLYNAADMFSDLKASFKGNTTEDLVQRIKTVQVLVLDDFGMNYGSDWEMSRLDEIIDYRYDHELITVVTTNMGIEQMTDRIYSRFSDSYLSVRVCNKGGDYRPNNKEGGN